MGGQDLLGQIRRGLQNRMQRTLGQQRASKLVHCLAGIRMIIVAAHRVNFPSQFYRGRGGEGDRDGIREGGALHCEHR